MKAMQMESWVTRLYHKMENGPWHLPISHKMHSQACLPLIRNSSYTQTLAQVILNGGHTSKGAYLNWRSRSSLRPECQGSALPPVLAPEEELKYKKILLFQYLVSTASVTTAIAPLERVKLLMQNQNTIIQSGRLSHPYRGIFNCFARTISNDGFISLWRGNTARVLRRCSYTASYFAFAINYENENSRVLPALAIPAYFLVQHPLDYADLRLATDIRTNRKLGGWQFNGILDVWRKTLKSDGIVGLYRGFTIEMRRLTMLLSGSRRLHRALDSGELFRLLGLQRTYWSVLMIYVGINVYTNMALYPMETLTKRMMMTSGEAIKYEDGSNAFEQIACSEGLQSFYNGGVANVLSIAAASVLNLFVLSLEYVPKMGKEEESSDDGQADPSYIEEMEGKGEEVWSDDSISDFFDDYK